MVGKNPVIWMFLFLAAGGILASLSFRVASPVLSTVMLAAAAICMVLGMYNFYLHARTRWPFRKDG
ncbi:MAG: hypothetical protein HKN78_02360 [Sphingomonadaceae bacterium]|nr:hypothetical protein [Sphingomonadaceae bacterium]